MTLLMLLFRAKIQEYTVGDVKIVLPRKITQSVITFSAPKHVYVLIVFLFQHTWP